MEMDGFIQEDKKIVWIVEDSSLEWRDMMI